jgi:hypothetical protein
MYFYTEATTMITDRQLSKLQPDPQRKEGNRNLGNRWRWLITVVEGSAWGSEGLSVGEADLGRSKRVEGGEKIDGGDRSCTTAGGVLGVEE